MNGIVALQSKNLTLNPSDSTKMQRVVSRISRLEQAHGDEIKKEKPNSERLSALKNEHSDLAEEYSVLYKKLRKQTNSTQGA